MAAAASAVATRTAASPSPHLTTIAQLLSPPLPAMSNENRTALKASISKWAGVGNNNGCGGRGEERKLEVSLSATQLKLLKERMGSDSQKDTCSNACSTIKPARGAVEA